MKKFSKPLIITLSIVLALAIIITSLSLWFVKPLSFLDNYDVVRINDLPHIFKGDENDEKIKTGLDKTKFSVMKSALEFNFGYAPKLKKDNNEVVTVKVNEIEDYFKPSQGAFLVDFVYNEHKSITVEGKEIIFDHAKMLVKNTNGEIMTEEILLYDNDKILDNDELEYEANVILAKYVGTNLYNQIAQIIG